MVTPPPPGFYESLFCNCNFTVFFVAFCKKKLRYENELTCCANLFKQWLP